MIKKILLLIFCSAHLIAYADTCPSPSTISISNDGYYANHFIAPSSGEAQWYSLDPVDTLPIASFVIHFKGATGYIPTGLLISCNYKYENATGIHSINLSPITEAGGEYTIAFPLQGNWKANPPELTCNGSLTDCPIIKQSMAN